MLDHAVRVEAETGLSLGLRLEAGPDVHPARVEPREERLLLLVRAVDEVERRLQKLLVHRLHALFGERAGDFAVLLAPFAKPRILPVRFGYGCGASEDAPRTNAQSELGILRVIGVLGLVLGVQVVEVAKEH